MFAACPQKQHKYCIHGLGGIQAQGILMRTEGTDGTTEFHKSSSHLWDGLEDRREAHRGKGKMGCEQVTPQSSAVVIDFI